jgi:hypothetical protein
MPPSIFISYRRTQVEAVSVAVAALRSVNLTVFFDICHIDPLALIPFDIISSKATQCWFGGRTTMSSQIFACRNTASGGNTLDVRLQI